MEILRKIDKKKALKYLVCAYLLYRLMLSMIHFMDNKTLVFGSDETPIISTGLLLIGGRTHSEDSSKIFFTGNYPNSSDYGEFYFNTKDLLNGESTIVCYEYIETGITGRPKNITVDGVEYWVSGSSPDENSYILLSPKDINYLGSNDKYLIWNKATQQVTYEFYAYGLRGYYFSPDSKKIATHTFDKEDNYRGTISCIDLETGKSRVVMSKEGNSITPDNLRWMNNEQFSFGLVNSHSWWFDNYYYRYNTEYQWILRKKKTVSGEGGPRSLCTNNVFWTPDGKKMYHIGGSSRLTRVY